MKTEKILLLVVVGIGAVLLYNQIKKSTTNDPSVKDLKGTPKRIAESELPAGSKPIPSLTYDSATTAFMTPDGSIVLVDTSRKFNGRSPMKP